MMTVWLQVPHETAMAAGAPARSQPAAMGWMLSRDSRAFDQPPSRAAQGNVAFLRCVSAGDPAFWKQPSTVRVTLRDPPELVNFEKVWCSHMLPLR
jgi:hypothetical protein